MMLNKRSKVCGDQTKFSLILELLAVSLVVLIIPLKEIGAVTTTSNELDHRIKRDASATTIAPCCAACVNQTGQLGKNITLRIPLMKPDSGMGNFDKEHDTEEEKKFEIWRENQREKEKFEHEKIMNLTRDKEKDKLDGLYENHRPNSNGGIEGSLTGKKPEEMHIVHRKDEKGNDLEKWKQFNVSRQATARPTPPPTSSFSKDVKTNVTIELGEESKTVGSGTTRKPSGAPPSESGSLLNSATIHYDARDITYFLESHKAHSISDPRAYFTEERTTTAMAIMLEELTKLPKSIRFAYVVRIFNELGRKIVSKMNYISIEVTAILKKTPDDLGNKPEVSMLVDAIEKAFESKEDYELREDSDEIFAEDNPITKLIGHDQEKEAVFNASILEVANRLANINSYFVITACKTGFKIPALKREVMADLLGESIRMGAKAFINELSTSDKYKLTAEAEHFVDRIFSISMKAFRSNVNSMREQYSENVISRFANVKGKSFSDLSPISDKTGLIGCWNTYLFTGLGSSERVIKVFSTLMSRVPPQAKSRWINMYISQVDVEIQRTLSGFVVMQGMPSYQNKSQKFLLNAFGTANIMPVKLPMPRDNYNVDKNKIPARCYLAGRRWRLVLSRALRGFAQIQKVITGFADKIGEYKSMLVHKSGNEIYRMCMPRVEVGLRGWGINGDPQSDGSQSGKFSLKNPIAGLNLLEDPFTSGIRLGYNLGVKVGFNKERNATLELESNTGDKDKKSEDDNFSIDFMAKASYRKAAIVAAKKAFEIAIREGYLASLKVSVRAGMQIPAEAGSRLSVIRCSSVSSQVGAEVGRSFADNYVMKRDISDTKRQEYIKIGESYGALAGQDMGETIGAVVGKAAAEEAFKRSIIRGGKLARAKFQLEEYETGAVLGFEHGLKTGKKIASSSTLDASAPRFFRLPKPMFAVKKTHEEIEVDHWEKDLIPPLTKATIQGLQEANNHTSVSGSLKGVYTLAKEVKKGFKRVSYSNVTYQLEVFADGYIKNNIAFLKLNGTVNKLGFLHGSIIARDIFNIEQS